MPSYSTHEMFYITDSPISFYIKFNYRMGGEISSIVRNPNPKKNFVAVQSLIFPDDVNSDDKYKYSR